MTAVWVPVSPDNSQYTGLTPGTTENVLRKVADKADQAAAEAGTATDKWLSAEGGAQLAKGYSYVIPDEMAYPLSTPYVRPQRVRDWMASGEWPLSAWVEQVGPTTDNLDAIQKAIDSGEGLLAQPLTYLCDGGLVWRQGLVFKGKDGALTKLYLADGANAHLTGGIDVTDLHLENVIIDGNKANQSIGSANPWRGIYLVGECHRIIARNVTVQNCVDHGCHISDGGDLSKQAGKDSVFEYCRFLNNGSAEHSAAGGPGGTGAGLGDPSGMFFHCYASGNYLNGFKTSNGTLEACVSEYNGGGMETGFASPSGSDARISNCIIQYNTAGGVRHMGQGDCFRMFGNLIQGNGQSGILIGSGVARALIAHNTIRNNGQDAANVPRSSTTGLDAITIISNSTVGPTNILIDGNIMEDTQDPGSKTQEYAVYIENDSGPIKITSSNQAIGNKNQALYLDMDGDEDVTVEDFIGLSGHYKDISTTTAPADTNTNTLKTHDILANERTLGSIYEVFCSGLISGTGGTKTVRLVVGGTSFAVISEASGDQQNWSISARIRRTDSTRYWVQGTAVENGGSAIAFGGTSSVASNSALTIAVSCTKGDGSDVITQEEMIISTLH